MIYVITFMLAFCSIVYELLLGQALSAFLGNTVLRYSITIGLYMMSLGIGSLIAEGRFVTRPVYSLLVIEILLTFIGGSSVLILFFINSVGADTVMISTIAHGLIIVIGILSGFEIPLLIKLNSSAVKDSDNIIIGINYLGAFLGTVVFALLLYPELGIVLTSFCIATGNALTALALSTRNQCTEISRVHLRVLFIVIAVATIFLVGCIINAQKISDAVLGLYLTS